MFALIAAVLVVMAIVELYVIVIVAQAIGVLNTIGLLLLFSLVGAWLAKREGFGVLARIRDRTAAREIPTNELIDGGLVLAGGLLLLIPGFVSDAFGLLLLFPPTRVLARKFVKRRFRVRVYGVAVTRPYTNPEPTDGTNGHTRIIGRYDGPDDVIDVEAEPE